MPQPLRSSAGATYLDKQSRIADWRAAARRAAVRLPSVQLMVLFGSLASGMATPRSDADILVVVGRSDFERPQDRIPELLGALSPLPSPVDLVVLTLDEFERARHENDPLVREALAGGFDLLTA